MKNSLFSLTLLLSLAPSLCTAASNTHCPETRMDDMAMVMRTQEKIRADVSDAKAVSALLLTRMMSSSAGLVGEVAARTGKNCIKHLALNNMPEEYREFGVVNLPVVGEMPVITAEDVIEILYSICVNGLPKDLNRDVVMIAGKTYAREKVLAALHTLAKLCGQDCPLPAKLKDHWLTKNTTKEVIRYFLDQGIAEVLRKLKIS